MKNNRCKTKQLRNDFLAPVINDLARIRIAKGLNQTELAHQLGVTDYLVAKWECGIRTPSTFNLHCWADTLDARILIGANDNKPPPSEPSSVHANDNGVFVNYVS